ncbi:MAG: MFS transporter [Gammaproteobacteria bacterium]|nr:MFS transporter [Gammaproteobacteria bacterium]
MAFLGGIGGGVVFPILPVLGLHMGLSAFMVGVILAANRVIRIGVNPFTGALVDRFGGRGVIAAGLFIEGVGTLGYIAAIHLDAPAFWFLAGRLVWGAGSSLLFVGAVAAVLTLSSGGNRGRLVARARSAISLGVPGGLVLGGLVMELANADTAFLIAMLLSVASGFGALAGIPRIRGAAASERQRGGGLMRDWRILLTQRRLAGIWLYAMLVAFCVTGVLLSTLVLLVESRGTSIVGLGAEGSAGLLMAVLMLAYAGTSLFIGRRIDLLARRTALLVGTMVVLAAGFAGLAWARNVPEVLIALLVIGVATGATTTPLITLIGDLVAPQRRGRAAALYQVAADVGSTAGPIVGLVLCVNYGFLPVFLGLAGVVILSLPVAFMLARAESRSLRKQAGKQRMQAR